MKAAKLALFSTAFITLVSANALAQLSYSSAGSAYSQNFNSLPNSPFNTSLGSSPTGWIDDTVSPAAGNFSIPGWYLYHPLVLAEGGYNGHQRVRIGAGTVNTGAFMSWGTSGSTDRALGSLASNTQEAAGAAQYTALRLRNDTGVTLGSFTLGYTGEQWRDGGAATPVAQTLGFAWSTTAAAVSDPDSSFTTVSQLSFSTPVFANTTTGAAVDGNVAGAVIINGFTVENINWLPGTDLWLRWADVNDSGNDHGVGIDDLTFSAAAVVPEPTAAALLGLGIAAMFLRRRND